MPWPTGLAPRSLLALALLVCTAGRVGCFTSTVVGDPVGGQQSVVLRGTRAEFLAAYMGVFKMSDGSGPPVNDGQSSMSVPYIDTLLGCIGGSAREFPDGSVEVSFTSGDLAHAVLLAVVGNFVTTGAGGAESPLPRGDLDSLPSVVVDVYTGRLQLVSTFSTLRAYFLETLLIVSIIAIARLSLVRSVTAVYTPPAGAEDGVAGVTMKQGAR